MAVGIYIKQNKNMKLIIKILISLAIAGLIFLYRFLGHFSPDVWFFSITALVIFTLSSTKNNPE